MLAVVRYTNVRLTGNAFLQSYDPDTQVGNDFQVVGNVGYALQVDLVGAEATESVTLP